MLDDGRDQSTPTAYQRSWRRPHSIISAARSGGIRLSAAQKGHRAHCDGLIAGECRCVLKGAIGIQKYWHAKDLLDEIEAVNPGSYPKPIIQKPSQRPGVKMDWHGRKDDFLTKDRFVTLYDKCGSIMHARNPFAPEPDHHKLDQQGPKWYLWIVNLLNAHLIRLVGDPNVYLIQMGSDSEAPTYAVFVPSLLPSPSQNG